MYIKNILLKNPRRYEESSFRLYPSVNVITGANGSGKTTILEAINVLSVARSSVRSGGPGNR
ncbi:MAG: AAA family ATPase [Candidatus Marinimicrobia bacterium]|nr:AAA family ATPase [Candidatus Neomarinimicrobiota bacterium]